MIRNHPVRVIAEAGTCNHSLQWAHEAVEAAAAAGCWGFKVQMLTADLLVTRDAPRYDRLAGPATQHEAFEGALPYRAWGEVFDHAREVGLVPFASCWDLEAVEVAADLGCEWFKLGSADITYKALIQAAAMSGNVILSTGASIEAEIHRAVDWVWGQRRDGLVLMACTLSYPCDLSDAQLGRIGRLKDVFGHDFDIGYSDHTYSTLTGGWAVAAGASYLEKHFTVTPGAGGDHDFGLDPESMKAYVRGAFQVAGMMDEHWLVASERDARQLARRSLHTTSDVARGDRLVVGVNCGWLRPSGGLEPWEQVRGVARRDLPAGTQVRHSDLL